MRSRQNEFGKMKPEGDRLTESRMTRLRSFILHPSSFILLALLLAGCASGGRTNSPRDPVLPAPPQPIDPLLGGPPAQPVKKTAASLGPPTTAGVPMMTSSTTTPSTAALAGGSSQPLDASHDLRIGPAPAVPVNDPRRGETAPGNVTLQQPQVVSNASPARTPPLPPVSGSAYTGGAQVMTYQQAQAVLLKRGVTWQRLETWGDKGEWKFSCAVPNPSNPNIRRNYEATARDDLSALRAVINQMQSGK